MQNSISRILVALSLLLCAPRAAPAQVIDLAAERQAITPIDTSWRTHPGDNPRWASPDFDDSAWKLIKPASAWAPQGFAEQNHMAWFRFQIKVAPSTKSLVIQLPRIERSYQLFANGQLIGQVGTLPPARPTSLSSASRVFTIPLPSAPRGQPVTLALRLWQDPLIAGLRPGILRGPAYVGEASTLLRQYSLTKAAALLSRGSDYTQDVIILIVGACALLLFWMTRQSLYLRLALNMTVAAANLPVRLASQHFAWNFLLTLNLYILLDFLLNVTFAFFVLGTLNLRSWKARLLPLLLVLFSEIGPLFLIPGEMPLIWANGIFFVFSAAFQLLVLGYLFVGWRGGRMDSRLLLFPYLINVAISLSSDLGHFLSDFNLPWSQHLLTGDILLLREPFAVTLLKLGETFSTLGLLAVLVYRFASTSREQQRLASALQAAHDIQHRLVPVDIPSLGGLRTEVVYLAAEEVGGDFCQVLPRSDGSILVAIGDVSGKGLQAAMLGTLAVGALRSIADEDLAPAAALDRLNHVVLRTESTGFITCLCLVLAPDGLVTLANAGHLAPYLNGTELPLDSALPLGILPGLTYQQTSFLLPDSARLTLLSDGVVEARDAHGVLFGFERTSTVSRMPAREIAQQANQHGQQDDITVITLDWQAPITQPVQPEFLHA